MPRKKVDEIFIEITPEIALRDYKWLCKGNNEEETKENALTEGADWEEK